MRAAVFSLLLLLQPVDALSLFLSVAAKIASINFAHFCHELQIFLLGLELFFGPKFTVGIFGHIIEFMNYSAIEIPREWVN